MLSVKYWNHNIKIIKEGIKPETKLYETQCFTCKTIFEFSQNEAIINYDRDGTFLKIACPLCSEMVFRGI